MAYAARIPGVRIAAVCDVSPDAYRSILADRSIDAVCISTRWHASITMEACEAGKDIFLETPAFVDMADGPRMVEAARKYGRVVQTGTVQRSGATLQRVREIVRSGELGEIAFCRAFQACAAGDAVADGAVHLMDSIQFAFDEAMPVSVSAQGAADTMLATFRYPGFVASYERRPAGQSPLASGIAFHGTRATLLVDRRGYVIFPGGKSGPAAEERGSEPDDARAAHWEDFLWCIRTRERPAGDIEACVRATTTCVLANLAARSGMTIGRDDWRSE
jgi:predicted dehydrogenase